jgi:hypothetical protein
MADRGADFAVLKTGADSVEDVIKVAQNPALLDPNKTNGRRHRQLLFDIIDTVKGAFSRLTGNTIRGLDQRVRNLSRRDLINASFLVVGMRCYVASNAAAGVVAGPAEYTLIQDSGGPLTAFIDAEPDTTDTVKARWVRSSGTATQLVASYPLFIRESHPYVAGDIVRYVLNGIPRLFQALLPLPLAGAGTTNVEPTGEPTDPNWLPFAPITTDKGPNERLDYRKGFRFNRKVDRDADAYGGACFEEINFYSCCIKTEIYVEFWRANDTDEYVNKYFRVEYDGSATPQFVMYADGAGKLLTTGRLVEFLPGGSSAGLEALIQTKENAGVAATLDAALLASLLDGVTVDGNTFQKLYNLIQLRATQRNAATIAARDILNVRIGDWVNVDDDGDGRWAIYRATSAGVGATFNKVSDPDLLNAVQTAAQIKQAYESNANTNAYTNAEKLKLASVVVNTATDVIEFGNPIADAPHTFLESGTITKISKSIGLATLSYSRNNGSSFTTVTPGNVTISFAANEPFVWRGTYTSGYTSGTAQLTLSFS